MKRSLGLGLWSLIILAILLTLTYVGTHPTFLPSPSGRATSSQSVTVVWATPGPGTPAAHHTPASPVKPMTVTPALVAMGQSGGWVPLLLLTGVVLVLVLLIARVSSRSRRTRR